jgi:hypothetical protein
MSSSSFHISFVRGSSLIRSIFLHKTLHFDIKLVPILYGVLY